MLPWEYREGTNYQQTTIWIYPSDARWGWRYIADDCLQDFQYYSLKLSLVECIDTKIEVFNMILIFNDSHKLLVEHGFELTDSKVD